MKHRHQVPEAGAAGAAGAASVGTPSEITASPPQAPPAQPPTTSPPQLLQPPASPQAPQSEATSPHEPHSSTTASPWQRAAFLARWWASRPPWQRSRWWRPWQRWRPWQPWPATAPESPPTRAIATRAKNIATANPRKRFIIFLQVGNQRVVRSFKPSRNNPDPGRLPDRSRRISCGLPSGWFRATGSTPLERMPVGERLPSRESGDLG